MNSQPLLTLLVLCLASTAWAVPTKFQSCGRTTRINHVPGSSGIILNEDCTIGYVLPPQEGDLYISHFLPTGNLPAVCDQYEDIESAISTTTEIIKIRFNRLQKLVEKQEKLEEQLENGLVPAGRTAEELEAEYLELLVQISDEQDKITKLQEKLYQQKERYANMEGANAKFFLESHFVELVEAYQNANPHLQVLAMPIEKSYMVFNQKSQDPGSPQDAPMNAVLSMEIPGYGGLPIIENLGSQGNGNENSPQTAPSTYFKNGATGLIQFSVLGACPFLQDGELPDEARMSDIEGFVTARTVYEYGVQVKRQFTAEYNLGQLAKRIATQSRKGGFFSRKTVNSLVETAESDKWIKFHAYEEDPNFVYEEDYKKELKQQFLNEVLKEIAFLDFTSSDYPSVLQPQGQSGASVGADGLSKCPHLYCQVGAYALKFLDATFGSTTAVSEYIKQRDIWAKQTINETRVIPQYGDYTFK